MANKIIIIPTYNEKENIEGIIRAVFAQKEDFDVLVVDDNSPDNTAAIVQKLQREFTSNLHLEVRQRKKGLGHAYIHGFQWVMQRDYDYIFEMDADFSHNPADLIRLYEACQTHDIAIGSRYSNGVNVVNWPMHRVLLSYLASKYVQWITGLPIQDTTAGFICYRRKVLESLYLKEIDCSGYLFQIKMKYLAWKKGFQIKEIPIIFTDRATGTSKISGNIINEALWGVILIKIKSMLKSNVSMKKIVLISLVLFFSCKSKIQKPPDLIPPDQMKNIFFSLFISKETAQFFHTKDPSKVSSQAAQGILNKHGVTEKQFHDSHNYYTLETDIYLKILEEVQDSLNRLSNQINLPPSIKKK